MTAARCLMVQGTASSVGKSVLVAALCRILKQDGYRVAPFKAQNMALNSFVTADGGEIGRAQAVQAEAARIAPLVDMNPILLKPEADARSQVIVRGRPVGVLPASEYYRSRDVHWRIVVESLARLRAAYDVVVIEGAGSPAEVNLKDGDIVNMRVAKLAEAPVLLVGDIDRGGVFASLVGTLELLDPDERDLVQGLVINKFRGDMALLGTGIDFLTQRTGKPVLGVIPYFHDIWVAEEDSVALESRPNGRGKTFSGWSGSGAERAVEVAVIRLPRVSNFDDFDPLEQEEGVFVRYVEEAGDLGHPDLVILPGTKTTIADLTWMRQRGLAAAVVALVEGGTAVIGICGGFQMLGTTLSDPFGVEGPPGTVPGLGLLAVSTTFAAEKTTCQVRAKVRSAAGLLDGLAGVELSGYEIHMGQTIGPGQGAFQVVEQSGRPAPAEDGVLGREGWVLGTYIHGLFDYGPLRRGILNRLAARKGRPIAYSNAVASRDEQYDRLAAHVRAHLDVDGVYRLLGV